MTDKPNPSLRVQKMLEQQDGVPPVVGTGSGYVIKPLEELLSIEGVSRGWKVAAEMVKHFQPVPRRVWPMIHSVYGKTGMIGEPDPIVFSAITQLLDKALEDKTLSPAKTKPSAVNQLDKAVKALGLDTVASLVFAYSVCRKASFFGVESIIRPILDDTLLRARIGHLIGKTSDKCGPGRGILAGISGRIGLAIQIAAGTPEQSSTAVARMADRHDISTVCDEVYGCDPLEVAALTLISAGCSRDIAYGVANFSDNTSPADTSDFADPSDKLQLFWCNIFSLVEYLRMGKTDLITDALMDELEIGISVEMLLEQTQAIFRRGHGWRWMIERQVKETGSDGLLAE